MKLTLLLLLIILGCTVNLAATHHVPLDYPTIQQAIDASISGDTVLVSPGRYYENIIFNGKNITIASLFLTTGDYQYIKSTIIDGSQPTHTDTASCVRIINGEDRTAQLTGFTLTKGTGTRWIDEHGAGVYYEGGGILIALSSPTISHNIVIDNEAIKKTTGTQSAGGGGIRAGDGAPLLVNNIIVFNRGMYGAGIVINYANAVVRNNIVANNRVYQAVTGAGTFGGGGVWLNGTNTRTYLENNTIINNSSSGSGSQTSGRGGGIVAWGTKASIRNNIVHNNIQTIGNQIFTLTFTDAIEYNLVQGGFAGLGNLNADPLLDSLTYQLSSGSPCIDAGSPSSEFNDLTNPLLPSQALYPSLGTERNDMGAFGGPAALLMGEVPLSTGEDNEQGALQNFRLYQNYPNPFNPETQIVIDLKERTQINLSIYDSIGNQIAVLSAEEFPAGQHTFLFNAAQYASGIYICRLMLPNGTNSSITMTLLK